ncbi:insulin receptor substrate 1-like isoform X2 [Biomphalaria glabrata]|uniref:Insulin receptor substrate 1 n=1 Tax=Biomphalaria glabrata TaxID=6526 RepID=A0A9U8E0R9_BIOGL|nr:insulin receptor substrate 1-like isoform X2 [Biomphalaria glabrata]
MFTFEKMDFDQHSLRSNTSHRNFERPGSDIKKKGYMKKMKTMKKKFFVLRSTSSSGPARLEYYDSEKKFNSGTSAKHPIHLHTCFNINKKSDSKHGKWGIVLYSKDECFTVLTESETEQNSWLELMLEYQSEYLPCGDVRDHYDHVWSINVHTKCLIPKGQYRLCLNENTLSLFKTNKYQPEYNIHLSTIRSIATTDNSFGVEVGKHAPMGEGEFTFVVEDASVAKDMHSILLSYMNAAATKLAQLSIGRRRLDSHTSPGRRSEQPSSRPHSCFPSSSSWQPVASPTSPNNPIDNLQPIMRPRTNTAESRYSHTEDKMEVVFPLVTTDMDPVSMVPPDMSPPSSPNHLDEQVQEYYEMDNLKNAQMTTSTSQESTYLNMASSSHSQKETVPTNSQTVTAQSQPDTYMTMGSNSQPQGYTHSQGSLTGCPGMVAATAHHGTAPIPMHSFSESHHSTLPTVREGGSNEGYLPMEMPNSLSSSTGILRPEPAKCMLSDDTAGLPPRTYSLGSRPVSKKDQGYMEMGPRGGVNDMSRATSAPHIINNLKARKEHSMGSPSQSASPLSASLKSDDSDSFMEYMPMRPRTASDSFNYRPRTSSFGKLQPMSRPRSSSHGQGTRPVKYSKLIMEQSRLALEPQHRLSQESSLLGSFESLRVSSESLRKMGHDIRKKTGSNASDYAEMRSTPSPQFKVEVDPGYMTMQLGTTQRKSSPHRIRSDSSSSSRRSEVISERSYQQAGLKETNDYADMAPLNAQAGGGDSYMTMEYNQQHSSSLVDKRPVSFISPSSSVQPQTDSAYFNMDMDSLKHGDNSRSASLENVDTYVVYDPQQPVSNKLRTGSVGARDKKISRPARKASSVSMSSSSPTSSGIFLPPTTTSASTSTRTGGSSDSIRKTSRQSSMEKNASLGKDFRKKSGSMGSKPSNVKAFFTDREHQASLSAVQPKKPLDDPDDEYIEFSPTVTLGDGDHPPHTKTQSVSQFFKTVQQSSSKAQQPGRAEDEAYTEYNPALPPVSKALPVKPLNAPTVKGGVLPSSVPQAKHVSAKVVPEYVGFKPSTNPPPALTGGGYQSGAVSAQDYVGFEPEAIHGQHCGGYQPGLMQGQQCGSFQPGTMHGQQYVGYQPGTMHGQQCGSHQSGALHTQQFVGYQSVTPYGQQCGNFQPGAIQGQQKYQPMTMHGQQCVGCQPVAMPGQHYVGNQQVQLCSGYQPGAKQAQDYVSYNPATDQTQDHPSRQSSAMPLQDYISYNPGTVPAQDNAGRQSSASPAQNYVGYNPGTVPAQDTAGHQSSAIPAQSYIGCKPATISAQQCVVSKSGVVPPRQCNSFQQGTVLVHNSVSYQQGQSPALDYVDYQPGKAASQSFAGTTTQQLTTVAKDQTSGQAKPTTAFPFFPLPLTRKSPEVQSDGQEYVGFEPGKNASLNYTAPGATVSYIQIPVVTDKSVPKQPTCSSQSDSSRMSSVDTKSNVMKSSTPESGSSSHSSVISSTQPAVITLAPLSSGQSPCLHDTVKQPCDKSCSSSSGCVPLITAKAATPTQHIPQLTSSSSQQCVTIEGPQVSKNSPSQVSKSEEESQYLSFNPAAPETIFEPHLNIVPAKVVCVISDKATKLADLRIDVSSEIPNITQSAKAYFHRQLSGSDSSSQSLSQQSATSSPSHHPSPDRSKLCDTIPDHTPSPETLNNCNQAPNSQSFFQGDNNKRHKHLSGPEITSPTPASSRQKHPSGSSQKNRKILSDTEKSFIKIGKSDSLSSNSSDTTCSSKGRRRRASGEKSSGSSTEKSPMSPNKGSGVEFFCGEASPTFGKSLEAKMVVVEAKIRHSVGDVTSLISTVTKDGHVLSLGDMTAAINKDGHGLVRPGSTPCMQNLESNPDACNRSTGSDPTSSGGSHFSSSSRSRHSIPDLGFFQQVASNSEQKANSSSGSGESCGNEAGFKPLNYLSLDLSISEGQGDADWKLTRCKSRNSSDADERQPPLSYAEIDFVRSQSLNKGKSLTTAGGDKS